MINFGLCAQRSLNPNVIALLVILGVLVIIGIVFAVIKIYGWIFAKRSGVRIITREEYLEELRKEREAAGLPFDEEEELKLLNCSDYKNGEIDNNSIDLNSDGENVLDNQLSNQVIEDDADDNVSSPESDLEEKTVFPIEEDDDDETTATYIDEDLEGDKKRLEKIVHPDEELEGTESLNGTFQEIKDVLKPATETDFSADETNEIEGGEVNRESSDFIESDSAYDDFIEKSVENGACVIEDEGSSGSGKIVFAGKEIRVRYLRSFTAKLSQSNDLVKERYSILKNELLSYKKAKARTSWYFETFRLGRLAYARFAVRGKTLTLYLALNPEDLVGTKYRFKDVGGVKKYAQTPVCVKIKSNRGVRWAKELISILANENGFKRLDLEEVDYYPEFRSTKDLILDKQIRLIGVDARKEFLKIQNDGLDSSYVSDFSGVAATLDGEVSQIDNSSIDLVEEGQNHAPYAVILEVDLDEKAALTKDDIADKPAIKTLDQAVEETLTETVEKVSDEKAEVVTEIHDWEYDGIRAEAEPLIEREFEIKESVSVYGADKVMTNEEAEDLIETAKDFAEKEVYGSAKAIINVDVLSNNFAAGETVTLKALTDKNLLPKKTGYFKVLGSGVINKPLVVEADEFSVNAAKMILLTGGRAIIVTR